MKTRKTRSDKRAERAVALAGPLSEELDTCPSFTAEALMRACHTAGMKIIYNPRAQKVMNGKRAQEAFVNGGT